MGEPASARVRRTTTEPTQALSGTGGAFCLVPPPCLPGRAHGSSLCLAGRLVRSEGGPRHVCTGPRPHRAATLPPTVSVCTCERERVRERVCAHAMPLAAQMQRRRHFASCRFPATASSGVAGGVASVRGGGGSARSLGKTRAVFPLFTLPSFVPVDNPSGKYCQLRDNPLESDAASSLS